MALRIVKTAEQVNEEIKAQEEAKVIAIKKALAKTRREAPLRNFQLKNGLKKFIEDQYKKAA